MMESNPTYRAAEALAKLARERNRRVIADMRRRAGLEQQTASMTVPLRERRGVRMTESQINDIIAGIIQKIRDFYDMHPPLLANILRAKQRYKRHVQPAMDRLQRDPANIDNVRYRDGVALTYNTLRHVAKQLQQALDQAPQPAGPTGVGRGKGTFKKAAQSLPTEHTQEQNTEEDATEEEGAAQMWYDEVALQAAETAAAWHDIEEDWMDITPPAPEAFSDAYYEAGRRYQEMMQKAQEREQQQQEQEMPQQPDPEPEQQDPEAEQPDHELEQQDQGTGAAQPRTRPAASTGAT
jgi:Sec-independent protein translocase protein TatA